MKYDYFPNCSEFTVLGPIECRVIGRVSCGFYERLEDYQKLQQIRPGTTEKNFTFLAVNELNLSRLQILFLSSLIWILFLSD